jgi:hypothetical protein
MKKLFLITLISGTVVILVGLVFMGLMGDTLVTLWPEGTATPIATLAGPLVTIEGGVAQIDLKDQGLTLDRRAAPFVMAKVAQDAVITDADGQPLSLFDLRSGDLMRLVGSATGSDSILAMHVARVQSVALIVPTATASITPSETPVATGTPPMPFGDRLPLPGNLIIADSGNNRIIEVQADKKIIWEFPGNKVLAPGQNFQAPNDVSFTPGNKTILASEERHHQIVEIDYATRKIIWSFGEWGISGADNRHLNTPDGAHRLPDASTVVSDMRNCRIAIVSPGARITGQIGKSGQCKADIGYLFEPNGSMPLTNRNLLVTEIGGHRVSEMDLKGKVIRSVVLPSVIYPSAAQWTRGGNVLVAAYEKPGRIVEVDWSGHIVWEYFPGAPSEQLDRPSVARELPNDNIVFTDDFNHRVVVVNRSGRVLWQYGVTGVSGKTAGYLSVPEGIDIRLVPIPEATLTAIASYTPPPTATATRTTAPTVVRTATRRP